MKQSIILPNRISHTVFKLPCVESVHKSYKSVNLYYCLYRWMMVDENQLTLAFPGDTLIEEDDGRWRLERNKTEKSQQTINHE